MLDRALLLLSPLIFVPFLAVAAWSSRDSRPAAVVHPAIEVEVARGDAEDLPVASTAPTTRRDTVEAYVGRETTGIEAARARAVGPALADAANGDDDRGCGDKHTAHSRAHARTKEGHERHDRPAVL